MVHGPPTSSFTINM